MDYQPIKCAQYDHFEILCMHRARVQISLLNGSMVEGVAKTLRVVAEKGEYLLLETENQGEQSVRLDQISHIVEC